MSTLTVTPDNTHSWARCDADFSDVLADAVAVVRTTVATGAAVPVRIAGPSLPTTEAFVQMNANPDFEAGIANWTALGGATLAQSTLHFTRGSHSIQITATATNGPGIESEKQPVIPGQPYSASASVFTSAANTLALGINWYTAAGTLISSTLPLGLTPNPALGATTLFQVDDQIAPPGAAQATAVLQYYSTATPGAGTLFFADEVRLLQPVTSTGTAAATAAGGIATLYDHEVPLDTPVSYAAYGYVINGSWAIQAGAPITSASVQVNSAGLAWLKDPGAPANSIPIAITQRAMLACIANGSPRAIGYGGISSETRAAKSSSMDVNNSEFPIITSKRRGSPTANLVLIPHTFADRDAIIDLMAAGSITLFQAPSQYGVPDRYMSIGDEQIDLLGQDQRVQPRAVTLPFVVTGPTVGPAQGPPGARYQDLCNRYASWGPLAASNGGTADDFQRTLATGLGTTDTGDPWTVSGSASGVTSVTPGAAVMKSGAAGSRIRGTLDNMTPLAAGTFSATITVPQMSTGSYIDAGVLLRYASSTTYYRMSLRFNTDGSVTAAASKRVADSPSDIATVTIAGLTYAAGSTFRVYGKIGAGANPTLQMVVWPQNTREPSTWTINTTDAGGGVTLAESAGFEVTPNTGITNAMPVGVILNEFRVTALATWKDVADGVMG